MKELTAHADAQATNLQAAKQSLDLQTALEIALPVLQFLSTFFLIPKKIRDILKTVVEIYNQLKTQSATTS